MKERPNLEEVIADIQKMIDENPRSYIRYIHIGTLMDILSLLKEQEAVKPVINGHEWVCGNCGYPVESCISYNSLIVYERCHKYCPECGRQVKWE